MSYKQFYVTNLNRILVSHEKKNGAINLLRFFNVYDSNLRLLHHSIFCNQQYGYRCTE